MIEVSSPALLIEEAYTPGLSREYVAKTHGVPVDDVAKLGSAENPFGPSPLASAAVTEASARIDNYPEWTARAFREAIAAKYGFEPDGVVCGSGETEVISLIIRAFAKVGDKIQMYEPCFPIYHIFAENEGRDLIDTVEKAINFDRETCRWTILGEAAEVQRSGERQRVLTALVATREALRTDVEETL